MKPSRLLLILACFSIICVLFSGIVSALEQDEARITPIWQPTETPTPGSIVMLTIFFINDYSEPLTIERVGVHIDWMEEEGFLGHDMSDNPVTVQSSDGAYFPPINVQVPQDASIGDHPYFVGVEGILANSTEFSWDSQTRTLQIQSSGEDGTNGGNGGDGATNGDGQQNQLLIIVGVAIVAGAAVLIMILIFRRNKTSNRTGNRPIENKNS
jgi:hypothetical protein